MITQIEFVEPSENRVTVSRAKQKIGGKPINFCQFQLILDGNEECLATSRHN